MIMADTCEQRSEALEKLLPYQRADFEGTVCVSILITLHSYFVISVLETLLPYQRASFEGNRCLCVCVFVCVIVCAGVFVRTYTYLFWRGSLQLSSIYKCSSRC